MKIRLMDVKTVEDYERYIFSGIDGQLVISIDYYDKVVINGDYMCIGTVVGIYIHDESGSAWILVRPYAGGFVEIDLHYNPNMKRGLFNNARFKYE